MSTNPRPAKRQRRSKVLSDDDDEPPVTKSSLPLRRQAPLRNSNGSKAAISRTISSRNGVKPSSARPSPKSSPEKGKKFSKLDPNENTNKSLHTFFNRVSEQDRWRKRSATPDEVKRLDPFLEDIVDDDDDSMEEALHEAIRRSETDSIRSATNVKSVAAVSATQPAAVPSSSQRFRKPTLPAKAKQADEVSVTEEQSETKPWADRYGPVSLEEVTVHKKKIQDVQKWVEDARAGRSRQRILILKGPAGAGKSTTLKFIAHNRRCDLVAWQNPDTSEAGTLSGSMQFADFVTRGGDYGALPMSSTGTPISTTSNAHILTIEEFPASTTNNLRALESFRSALLRAATTSNTSLSSFSKPFEPRHLPPIVLVISETLVSSSTAFTDSFTAQRLLGPELINHPAVCVIEFNSVAPTFLSKALDLVVRKEARDSKRRRIPGPAVLQRLAEIGDIRSAINSLQFLCTRGDNNEWSGTVATMSKRVTKSNQPLTPIEENSLKLISSRETTLDMFHAAGKVCYNKREDPRLGDPKAHPLPKPPDFLSRLHRPKVSQVDVEELLNETGTDIQTFVSTVQQNYILSCNHEDFVDYFDSCATVLSDSELLDPDSRMSIRSKARASASQNTLQLGTSDSLRQDEISFQVATRGVLFNLPFPVSRAAPPGAGKGAAHKMYYPVSLRLWRPIEETNGLIDLTISQLSGRATLNPGRVQDTEGVASWRTRANTFETGPAPTESDTNDAMPRADLSRDNLVLDTLPYMTRIKTAHGHDTSILQKITQLHGFNAMSEGEADDDESPTEQPTSTVKLTQKIESAYQTLQARRDYHHQQQQHGKKEAVEESLMEKLYIEDDDIEDD
ncbi:RFC checkpoint protein Rad17 [Lithohypha guttulata]|uniref:RFC checkpoint protein Rad17 n=1 Tax=Lithohypha guttulata TaxID=1690604 RepID=UPI00315D9B1B